jgi:hypothetical protein
LKLVWLVAVMMRAEMMAEMKAALLVPATKF